MSIKARKKTLLFIEFTERSGVKEGNKSWGEHNLSSSNYREGLREKRHRTHRLVGHFALPRVTRLVTTIESHQPTHL